MASKIKDLPFIPSVGYVFFIKHVVPSGTTASISGKGITVVALNTVEGDSQFVSLSSNQFTLQPGNYVVSGTTDMNSTGITNIYIRETAGGTKALLGESNISDYGSENIPFSIEGVLTVTTETTYEFVRNTSVAATIPKTTFGVNEVYTSLTFIRL